MNADPQSGRSPEPGAGAEELEALLLRQRFRRPPADWRDAILAQAAIGSLPGTGMAKARSGEATSGWWDRWLSGWTLVAAAWALALALHVQTMPVRDTAHPPLPPLSAAALADLAAQQAALREIST